MKVKVPKQIRVITHPYRVRYIPHLMQDENHTGVIDHRQQYIGIEPILAPSEQATTLIHEQLEGVARHYSLDLSHGDLDRIAQGFASFLFNDLGIELDWSDIT